MTCRLNIVALPYYEAGGCLSEFFAEAQGRAMTLRPEPTNEFDANAISAYDWQGRHVGYVAVVIVILGLVAVIVFQRWRISDCNVHLEKFITENMELRERLREVEE